LNNLADSGTINEFQESIQLMLKTSVLRNYPAQTIFSALGLSVSNIKAPLRLTVPPNILHIKNVRSTNYYHVLFRVPINKPFNKINTSCFFTKKSTTTCFPHPTNVLEKYTE